MVSTTLDMADIEPEIIHLPELGQTYVEGTTLKMVELTVTKKLTVDKMKPYLDAYGLGHSAKRDVLIDRLRNLAKNPALWNSQFQSTPTKVRGGNASSKRSQNRSSAKRFRAMFEDENKADTPEEHPSKRVAISFPDQRTAVDITKAIELAQQVVALAQAHVTSGTTPLDSEPGQNANEASLLGRPVMEVDADVSSTTPAAVQRQLITLTNAISHGFGFVGNLIAQHGLPAVHAPTQASMSATTHSPTVTHQTALQSANTSNSIHPPIIASTHLSPSSKQAIPPTRSAHEQPQSPLSGTSVPHSAPLDSAPPRYIAMHSTADNNCTEDCRTATLTDGVLVHFRSSDLRPPPTISFADDVSKLFREWYRSDYIVLGGRGIPISEWDKLYKKKIAIQALVNAWDTFRSTWGNWKFIITEFERLGCNEVQFFAKFRTDEGARMRYQEILDHLQLERKKRDADLGVKAARVKDFFGGNLECPDAGNTFTYKKSGRVMTVSKNTEIVSRFEGLCSMDLGVQSRWNEFESS
ncbi:uncharacterized protein STEHIDRAFT_108073 [Stereum hirsutum FP-91666 SS1]|uniref:uncharacterized protein n=1 Tax=Stereum hirsutum (strain FP-91666) TaxID=721885 RepID=UPI000440FC8E|nr:uncharacterized protein STEHIDRAFT_108073 [Stereum hirsutum FP-91666 SS1]EIM91543.1 hypothetical protein STEHIDRAFT_108073 [Stereum hirsutum FP-91666 SS1]